MKKILIFKILLLISCNSNNSKKSLVTTSDSLCHIQKKIMSPKKTELNIDYNSFEFIFDTLSSQAKRNFIMKNKKFMTPLVCRYYGHYNTMNNVDSIFEVLTNCRIDSITQRDLLPFNVYVLTELLQNKKIDGYIGEFITDMFFDFFAKYPGYFHQYIQFLEYKNNSSTKKEILYRVANGIYLKDIDDIVIDSMFENQQLIIKNRKKEIINTVKEIKKYKANF